MFVVERALSFTAGISRRFYMRNVVGKIYKSRKKNPNKPTIYLALIIPKED